MLRKPLLCVFLSVAGLTLLGASARSEPVLTQSGQQSQQATKSVAGTVSSITNGGRAFALDVNEGGSTQTIQFVVDKDTQVQGQLKVGTAVMVEYVAMADQNIAKSVAVHG